MEGLFQCKSPILSFQTLPHAHTSEHARTTQRCTHSIKLCFNFTTNVFSTANHLIMKQIQSVVTVDIMPAESIHSQPVHSSSFAIFLGGYSVGSMCNYSVLLLLLCVDLCQASLRRCWSGTASAQSQSGSPRGPGFTGMINNNKWQVPSVLCLRLHWAYLFCGCRL